MQSWIERTVLHLQKMVRGPLNVLADLMAVSGSIEQRSQDQHVKSALEKARALWLYLLRHRRQSTLNLVGMVDARPSPVKECQRRAHSQLFRKAAALASIRLSTSHPD